MAFYTLLFCCLLSVCVYLCLCVSPRCYSGVINISIVGVGLLFYVGMLTGGFGVSIGMVAMSGFVWFAQLGIGFYKTHLAMVSVATCVHVHVLW